MYLRPYLCYILSRAKGLFRYYNNDKARAPFSDYCVINTDLILTCFGT